MLRKLLLCTVAIAALPAHVALAADLPLKAPPQVAMAWSWAGFYLGAHGGYGWGRNDFSQIVNFVPTASTVDTVDSRGWLAGGHSGYNWQRGRLVAGFEVDGSASGIRGESAPATVDNGPGSLKIFTTRNDVKYLGTARLRAGGVPFANGSVMLYATAGLGWERIGRSDRTAFLPATLGIFTDTQSNDRFGWVAGLGGEFRLGATNWVGRIEYLHYDFGMVEPNMRSTLVDQDYVGRGGRQAIDAVRGGLSYKFGEPSAPLSAYAAYTSVKAAPSLAWSWAGFYLGAHSGYGWARNDFVLYPALSPPPLLGDASSGLLAGAHGGFNWQAGRWVTGFEMDGSRAWIHGDTDTISIIPFRIGTSDDVKYLGTLRARLGAAPFANADILLYGTAGLAWERFERVNRRDISQIFTSQTTVPRDHFGWVAGVGGEVRLGATNWIGRVEYLHYDFGTVETTTSKDSIPANINDFTDKGGRHSIDVVRGGLSYKFGTDGASSAYAAYASAAPVAAPIWSWAGYYLGVHAGYGWGQNDFSQIVDLMPFGKIDGIASAGWLAGGQAGYNWQFDRWVAGIELDGSATRIRGDSLPLNLDYGFGNVVTTVLGDDIKYVGTLRARLGGVPIANADVLLYGTAGLAWERINRNGTSLGFNPQPTGTSTIVTPRDPLGWVAGAGSEFRLGNTNWIGRIEYLHYDFGTIQRTYEETGVAEGFAEKGGRQTIDTVRGGVSYKFGAMP